MKPFPHQIELADKALKILRKYLLVYLTMEERTGKTMISLMVANQSKAKNIVILTNKQALEKRSFHDPLDGYIGKQHSKLKNSLGGIWKDKGKTFTLINYHSIHKLEIKEPIDLVILDESHLYVSSFPSKSSTWKKVKKLTKRAPIIYMSATPSATSYAQLYHQMALSDWSPYRNYPNFKTWFSKYGKIRYTKINDRLQPIYDDVSKKAFDDIKHLCIAKTRKQIGFTQEPKDVIHYVEPSTPTKDIYNRLIKGRYLKEYKYMADSKSKLRLALHQIEGGTLKLNDTCHTFLPAHDKIKYILDTWGDTEDIVIFYEFKAELELLKDYFKYATLLQSTSYSTGIDLHKYDTSIIYSMNDYPAHYVQRRARLCHINRKTPIQVHYLLTKNGVSHQKYNTVAVKRKKYGDPYFEITLL